MAGFWQRWFGRESEVTGEVGALTSGTRATGLQVVDVIDGDTLRVTINGEEESLRLLCVDTEESQSGGSKPVTRAGKLASEMAKDYFSDGNGGWCKVDIEFESDAPLEECLKQERGNYGRLLTYIFKDGENYNLHSIQGGWTPYFVKYGQSRFYHKEFLAAEASAQANRRVIWDPATNEGGASRDYDTLMPWWSSRGSLVDAFRREGRARGALDARDDYPRLLEAMRTEQEVSLFCDLQGGFIWVEGAGLIHVGTKDQPCSLWFPGLNNTNKTPLVRLIEDRYAGYGRGYVYVTGKVTSYKDKPQIVITSVSPFADVL